MKRTYFFFFLLLIISLSAFSQSSTHATYIKDFQKIAINEMNRAGIPASIKLAQGILESAAGTSLLARQANNHFGIKCGGDWNGPTFYKKDDDRRNGRLVKSCFRKYRNPESSFIAHSEFLKKDRYKALFRLKPDDYKGWARGLQKAGYATSNTYATKLIRLIEDYKLYQFDKAIPSRPPLPSEEPVMAAFVYQNHVKAVKLDPGKDIRDISSLYQIPISRLKDYNDLSSGNQLKEGQLVYLQPKRKKYKGNKQFHKVSGKLETMFDISQQYGVKLKCLQQKNLLNQGQEPATGARVSLKKKQKIRPLLREKTPYSQPQKPGPTAKPVPPVSSENPTNSSPPVNEKRVHTVQAGDTLYSLSRKYRVSVTQLKEWNKLKDNTIHVGQNLQVEN